MIASRAADMLALPIALPIAAAFLMPVVARWAVGVARLLGVATVLASLAVSIYLAVQVGEGGPLVASIGGFAAPFGITLYADGFGIALLVALNAGGLLFWGAGAGGELRSDVLMVLLMGAGAGLALSGDLFNLFVFYEITAVASYGLVASAGRGASAAAALRFLLVGALGSTLALLGIALVYAATGTLNLADIARLAPERLTGATGLTAFVFLVLGFGVKAELVPVNTWVPEVYGAAPVRVTALLAGIVSKLAIVIVLRLVVLAFPGEAARDLLLLIGIASVVAGELAALGSRRMIEAFAYSSISQLGLIAIASAISGSAGVAAAIALALHHALVKPALIMLASNWGGEMRDFAGGARATPLAGAAFVILALSLVGVPPLPGFWAKYMLVSTGLAHASPLLLVAIAVVLAAVVVEAAYMIRIGIALYAEPAEGTRETAGDPTARGSWRAMVFAAAVLVVMLATPMVLDAIARMAAETADRQAYIARVLPAAGTASQFDGNGGTHADARAPAVRHAMRPVP